MEIEASVLILTKNAGMKFGKVLEKVFSQKKSGFEVIVVDSGSKDETLDICSKFPVKLYIIKEEEFGHGKTRNFAAEKAKGEYLVYLTQDAVPKSDLWLWNLIHNFSGDTAGVYGRQVAKNDSGILEEFFYKKKYREEKIEWNNSNWKEEDIVFSNANCAIKKKVFEKNRFSEKTIVSEDYEWAFRVLKKGYDIVYEPKAEVFHSHKYGVIKAFKRYFDIGYSYSQIYKNYNSKRFFGSGTKFLKEELEFISSREKYLVIPYALLHGFAKFLGLSVGRKAEKLLPRFVCKALSGQNWYWQ